MQVVVLRLGHRIPRDPRLTTHVCLTARALGADGVIITDVKDKSVESSVNDVVDRFGGPFFVKSGMTHGQVMKDWTNQGGEIVHLTAYGQPLPEVISRIRESGGNKLVVVGAEKVPAEIFHRATWNVAVTNQPMSEVGALAVFLDWLFERKELVQKFEGARVSIIPSERGKKIVETQLD